MKTLSLLLLFLPILGFSQKPNKNDVSTTSLYSVVYDLTQKTLAPSSIHIPFKSIEIVDARFDTSKLGYELNKKYDYISFNDFKQIKLVNGVKESLQFFYNDYYKLCLKDQVKNLLIVLKTLWIDQAPANNLKYETGDEIESNSISFQNIHVKWEYYIHERDRYYPFKRVDTVYRLTNSVLNSKEYKFRKNDLSFFMFVLKSQLEQIDLNQIVEKYDSKRSLSFHNVDSFNKKRFLIPVSNVQNIKKGVFLTFDEFKNNTPSIEQYELKQVKKETYWVNSRNSERINDFYLMCDSIGIHTGAEKRISVIRVGKTFEFFGAAYIPVSHSLIGNLLNSGSATNVYLPYGPTFGFADGGELQGINAPRQINMETGEIY